MHRDQVDHMDHAAIKLLLDRERSHRAQGGKVIVEEDALDLRDVTPVAATEPANGTTR